MAEYQHMVPRTSRQQIALGLVFIGSVIILGLIFSLRTVFKSPNPIYSASADDLDLAVLDGIVGADKDFKQISATKAVETCRNLGANPRAAAL